MHYKKREWYEEIDPAFNKIITRFLEGLKLVEIPSDQGYLILSLSEDQLKNVERQGFPTIAKYYEKGGVEDFFDDAKTVFFDDMKDMEFKKIRKETRKKGL